MACLAWRARRPIRYAVAATRSTSHFRPSAADARVFYEPGAETLARAVAEAMPSAVATVERQQFGPFDIPVRVYVCASIDSLVSYGADSHAGGFTLNHRVFISPKPENTVERIPRVVTHELSHLHLSQHRGPWENLPVWFVEGLAAEVSGGGGAEGVTVPELRQAISDARTFEPKTSATRWVRDGATASHLSQHLFYGEAGLFIAYLRALDPNHFSTFIRAVERDQPLSAAFEHAYDTPLEPVWQRFVAAAKTNESL
jgi:hypothetical protein